MPIINFVLIILNTLILVSGQFLWKWGVEKKTDSFQSINSIIQLFLSPYVLSGILLYGLATILWLFILTRTPLSVAYPIQSIAYIIAVIGAYFVFGETLSFAKIMGCVLIMAGVSLIGISAVK